jgi:hypothetical protein
VVRAHCIGGLIVAIGEDFPTRSVPFLTINGRMT